MKNKKNNFFLLATFFVIFLSLSTNFVSALEVSLPGLGDKPSLGEYAVYLFKWGTSIAGGLALISFTIGAVGLIMSCDSSEAASNAKDRMKGSLLGLVLILASFAIINTINPTLTTLTLDPLEEVVIPPPPPQPGVYFYLEPDAGCSTNGIGPFTSSLNDVGSEYRGKIKSVKIINDAENDIYYGAIFHKEIGLENGGECGRLIGGENCQSVNIKSSAIDIFRLNTKPDSSGDGVSFFSEPFGPFRGSRAGFYKAENINMNPSFHIKASEMDFHWEGVNQPDEYKNKFKTFQDRPGSIDTKGDYLVVLSSGNATSGYCQTFTRGREAPDLNAQAFVAEGKKIEYVDIFPIK